MTIGLIRTFSVDQGGIFTNPIDNSVYARCDGQTLARSSYPNFSPLISGTNFGSDAAVNMKVPTISGMYLRGQDFGRAYDPDRATRFPLVSASPPSGDVCGSYQFGQLGAHRHVYTNNLSYPENPGNSLPRYTADLVTGSAVTTGNSPAASGSINPSGIDGTDVRHVKFMPYIRIA
jgi:microcystin-dependent protein